VESEEKVSCGSEKKVARTGLGDLKGCENTDSKRTLALTTGLKGQHRTSSLMRR